MFDLSNGWVLTGWVIGPPVAWVVTTLLFLAGCALADVPPPSLVKAGGVVAAALAVCVPLGWVAMHFLGKQDADPSVILGPMRILALGLSLLASWVVSAVLYALFLAAPYTKGLVIAAVELLLGTLLTALLSGVVLVVLALVQIGRKPEPPRTPKVEPPPKALLAPALLQAPVSSLS